MQHLVEKPVNPYLKVWNIKHDERTLQSLYLAHLGSIRFGLVLLMLLLCVYCFYLRHCCHCD